MTETFNLHQLKDTMVALVLILVVVDAQVDTIHLKLEHNLNSVWDN